MKKVALALLILISFNSYAIRYYVNASATGSNNGLSWVNAYTNLQEAISVSSYGDEIWIAAGIYKPSTTNNRSSSFVMKNGVNIYGGFSGTETSIAQRDIASNPTTLSGDIGELGLNTDNSRTVVRISSIATNLIFDGLRVVSGYHNTDAGGGLYISENSGTITISNCVIYNNYASENGGGAVIDASTVILNDCEFLYNSCNYFGGGAIYSGNVSGSTITINRCRFIGNSATSSAVIAFDGTSLTMDRVLATSNTARGSGGLIRIGNNSRFTLSNSLLAGNYFTTNQQSIIENYANTSHNSKMINVTMCHNRSNGTGTISSWDTSIRSYNAAMLIANCIIYGNSNALEINSGNTVINSIVRGNYTGATNTVSTAPVFVNPSTLAAAPFDASNFDYTLHENSVGVNSGDNTYVNAYAQDYFGNTRIQGTIVDRGAIESITMLSAPEFNAKAGYFFDISNNTLRFNAIERFINASVNIFDTSGKSVFNTKITEDKMQIDLRQGIYIVTIEGHPSLKIIILK